jgi:hypothetical protein
VYLSIKGLLDHIVIIFLIFWGAPILFSIMAVIIYPTSSLQRFPFSTSMPMFVIFVIVVPSYLKRYEIIFIIVLIYISLIICDSQNLFICL